MDDEEAGFWATALAIRGEVNRAIETARGDKTLGASLEAKAVIYASDAALAKTIESRAEELKQAFIVSQFEVVSSADDVTAVCGTQCVSEITAAQAKLDGIAIGMDDGAVVKVGVCKADGAKCARCWGYFGDLGSDDRHPELCPRCTPIVIEKDPELRVPAKKAEEVAA
jgi:isoleucyl-tRNA synthetase